jgi:hypothetical protein
MLLALLGFLNSTMEFMRLVFEKAHELLDAVMGVFRPRFYIFFENSPFAYESSKISSYATGSRAPAWVYSPTDKMFFHWRHSIVNTVFNSFGVSHNLPIISLEVVNKETGKVDYDLTEFVEHLKVRQEGDRVERVNPSIAQILGAWALQSGVVVDPSRFSARFIDAEADERTVAADDMGGLGKVAAAAEPVAVAEPVATAEPVVEPAAPAEPAKED